MMQYIAFEGIDGCGKSSQVKIQLDRLRDVYGAGNMQEFRYSAKDNFVGEIIKRVYHQGSRNSLSFVANRRFAQEALYALNARYNLGKITDRENGIIVSDRSIITAYASHAGILPEWYIHLLEPNFVPGLAVYIDVPPEVAHERIFEREDLYMDENLVGLQLFHKNYQKIFNGKKLRSLANTKIEIIDGAQSLEDVADDISLIVDSWIIKQPLVIN